MLLLSSGQVKGGAVGLGSLAVVVLLATTGEMRLGGAGDAVAIGVTVTKAVARAAVRVVTITAVTLSKAFWVTMVGALV